jgi:hypothetical protein
MTAMIIFEVRKLKDTVAPANVKKAYVGAEV